MQPTFVTVMTSCLCHIRGHASHLCYISCHALLIHLFQQLSSSGFPRSFYLRCIRECFLLPCRLLLLLSEQGTILDRSWRQLREYDSQASQVLPWLNSAEDTLARYMAQPVKPDPTAIKQQISDLRVSRNERTRWTIEKKNTSWGPRAVPYERSK